MQNSHDPRRDLIDTYTAAEHLVDGEAHIAQSHCAAVNRYEFMFVVAPLPSWPADP